MNLLDTASLVVTPNGYKASKLYSIIPSDGTGDMTFARTGDTATRVNSSGLIETVLANKPRLDYLGSTCPKLLLEPQRTNLILRSQEFDNASWVKENGGVALVPVVTANNAISPDGSQNAELIVFDLNGGTASGTISQLAQTVTTSISTVYTFTIYAKTSDNSTKAISLVDGNGSPILITITSSWQRFSITFTAASTTSNLRLRLRGSASGEGTATSASINIYGAQLESGAYATSYIPTTTASVTRNIDVCSKTLATALIGQTEGTMFWDGIISNTGSNVIFNLNLNATNDRYIEITSGLAIRYIEYSTTTQASISTAGNYVTLGNRYKIAAAYKANDFVLYVNGVQIGTDTSGTVFAADKIYNGYYASGFQGLIKNNSIALWKTRLTNQELVTLTTI